ncbi:uncharacterized protein A4U43_C09F10900 [Asparagus officinalis]|uniref:Uncharacterized protein n=1 Tax=Asparagus officinalis TaxID=4686 RepID=A0A5P1E6Q2_ASPOF|nr:uncharacterized protein A4U43_C09F10900 [Asparagus officinalis]
MMDDIKSFSFIVGLVIENYLATGGVRTEEEEEAKEVVEVEAEAKEEEEVVAEGSQEKAGAEHLLLLMVPSQW